MKLGHSLVEVFQLDHRTNLEIQLHHRWLRREHHLVKYLAVVIDETSMPSLRLASFSLQSVHIKPADGSSGPNFRKVEGLRLRFIAKSKEHLVSAPEVDMVTELDHIIKVAEHTISRVSGAIGFSSDRQAGTALAEAILRTTDCLTSNLQIYSAEIVLGEPGTAVTCSSTASWRQDLEMPPEPTSTPAVGRRPSYESSSDSGVKCGTGASDQGDDDGELARNDQLAQHHRHDRTHDSLGSGLGDSSHLGRATEERLTLQTDSVGAGYHRLKWCGSLRSVPCSSRRDAGPDRCLIASHPLQA